jgi:Flp pilus assembly protein TadG
MRILTDAQGNVASMFALIVVGLFGFVGGAIDFVQVHRMRTAVGSAVDAGVLAAARVKQTGGSDTAALDAAEAFVTPVLERYKVKDKVKFKFDNSGTAVLGETDFKMSTAFLRVIGLSDLPVKISNAASFGNPSNVELALMLDTTGSMSGLKLADLKGAVNDLIGIVLPDVETTAVARIAIAPFSNAVRLDKTSFESATGKSNSGKSSYSGCVVERVGAAAYTDASPMMGGFVVPIEDAAAWTDCYAKSDIVPLTGKKTDLQKAVTGLTAEGGTAGHLGTAWAWYLLSPNWSSMFDKDNQAASYDDLKRTVNGGGAPYLRKIAVLMTDGEYNTQYSATESSTQATSLCTEMKKTGIEVFTVGFAIGATGKAVDTLKACASDESHFYNAADGNALKQAFRDIALKSSPLRLVK